LLLPLEKEGRRSGACLEETRPQSLMSTEEGSTGDGREKGESMFSEKVRGLVLSIQEEHWSEGQSMLRGEEEGGDSLKKEKSF